MALQLTESEFRRLARELPVENYSYNGPLGPVNGFVFYSNDFVPEADAHLFGGVWRDGPYEADPYVEKGRWLYHVIAPSSMTEAEIIKILEE